MIPRSEVLSIALQARRIASVVAAAAEVGASTSRRAFLINVFIADLAATFRRWFLRDLMTSFLTDLILGTGFPSFKRQSIPQIRLKRKQKIEMNLLPQYRP